MSKTARLYTLVIALCGTAALLRVLAFWQSEDTLRFVCYFLLASLASGLKVHLPGIRGTMSVNFFFVLLCVSTLSLPETLIIACTGTICQCVWRSRTKARLVHVVFNVSTIAIATTMTYSTYHLDALARWGVKPPLLLVPAACVYFLTNTIPIAMIVSLTEAKPLLKVWRECYFWSFGYYLIGAAIVGILRILEGSVGWDLTMFVLPVLYWVYRSYRLYLDRLYQEKKHVEEMAALHLRTIEALALAIEAKDATTYDHLRRVGTYVVEIGKELRLSEGELQALQAAALLHDIGKLAVPEHIISKPGRLTPVEFEKMKIHPLIGAEILEEVQFPYPVVPVVRAHHEKWDGSGYPSGLKGEEIPIGARILTVVDCFDALTSHRQYRRATSVEDAIAYLREQSGKSFDPRVVSILVEKHQELEKKVQALPLRNTRLSKNVRITRGAAPATGLDSGGAGERTASRDFLSSIAAARQEAQGLLELTHELGSSLSLDETLSVVSVRLKRMCPHDCIAIYVVRENVLVPEYVNGENFQLFSSLRIPMGEGLSGWVAQNRSPIVNGSPSVEPGYLDDPSRFSPLRSALSVPLEGLNGVAGVLSLYAAAGDAFSQDHLRILSAVTTKIALSVENALKYRQAESSAITDVLTGLPNARSLFLHLDGELARAKREGTALSVLVCDLDGFKQINDHFGHLHGNRVLRRVAEVLRENCRGYDYVARMGGDEFVLVLPGQPGDILGAKTSLLADAVRRAGQDATGTTALSLSIGAASYPADGAGAEQLLDEADRRMYKAKQAGKLAAGQPSSMEDLARFRDSLAGASQSGPSESPATPGPARAASAPGPASGFIP